MFSIPAKLYKRFGALLVVPVVLLTILAVVLVGQVRFRSGFSLFLPENDPYRVLEEEVAHTFSQDELVIVALDVEELIAPGDLQRIEELVAAAQSVQGTSSVVSLTNLQDMYVEDGSLERRAVYRPDADPQAEQLTERVLGTPLFRDFFVSQDEKALYTYVVPEPDQIPAEFGESLVAAMDAPDVHFFGDAVAKAYVSRAVMQELVLLGSLALIVVFIVEILVSRSLLVGFVLSVVSMVPAIWTLALFPLLGNAVETTTMMVPVIVLVLATSYGIHIYRYHALESGKMADTLEHVGKIVVAAGFTTMIGFLSLLVTPSQVLTQLGTLIIFGIFAALITSFLLLPPVLAPLTDLLRRKARTPHTANAEEADAATPRHLRWLRREPKRPVRRLLIVGAIVLVIAAFVPSVRAGYSARDTFRSNTEIAQAVAYFQERAGATHDLEVYIDSGEQYGLVYANAYNRLREIQAELEADPAVARVISYVDFVEFMVGRLEGKTEPVRPETDAEIGEAMELLSGEGIGLSFNAILDQDWGQTRILLQASFPAITDPAGVEAIEDLLDRIRGYSGAPPDLRSQNGSRVVGFTPEGFSRAAILGVPVENLQHITYLTRSQLISLLAFAPIIVGFLILVFRSVPWALLSLLPTAIGVTVYFGVLGVTGFLHDPIHVFMVAALMGIANDDVLYFVLVFRREYANRSFSETMRVTVHKTGAAIIQTTLILSAGIATFYFSRFILLGRAGFVVTMGLIAATTTTLVVIPAVLKLSPRLLAKTRRGMITDGASDESDDSEKPRRPRTGPQESTSV